MVGINYKTSMTIFYILANLQISHSRQWLFPQKLYEFDSTDLPEDPNSSILAFRGRPPREWMPMSLQKMVSRPLWWIQFCLG